MLFSAYNKERKLKVPQSHSESTLQRTMHILEAEFWITKNSKSSAHETNKNSHQKYVYVYFP